MLKKPDWLRVRFGETPNRHAVEELLRGLGLNTVCAQAGCPNVGECFSRKTATFMAMGTHCTRDCRFCAVHHGTPEPLNPEEPVNIARAVKALGLKYVVVTSVTRDDLSDGGAAHFAQIIAAIRQTAPNTAIEVLIPDLQGDWRALELITRAAPDVISHNMETVRSLAAQVRPQAAYERSLELLRQIKLLNPGIRSKSGFMLGLGESKNEVHALLDDLRDVDCEFLTIGQYLAPGKAHLPVQAYIAPACFDEYAALAKRKGFAFVASAPLVRSSYRAEEALHLAQN